MNINQDELIQLGITPQEIEDAGGIDALRHIMWIIENVDDFNDNDIEQAMASATEKKQQETLFQQAFTNISKTNTENIKNSFTSDTITTTQIENGSSLIQKKEASKSQTIKILCEYACKANPHPALRIMLEAYFFEEQETILDDDDYKNALKTIALFRSYVAGSELPQNAEEEKLIAHARQMYKEFLEDKEEYHQCPMTFLLDDFKDELPEKYRAIANSLPISAILKIFAEYCFYDPDTADVDEPLPEEIDIKSLCEMIERLAKISKVWQ